MKQKIQVTTVHIPSDAQVIVPNMYFVTKSVKSQLAIQRLKEEIESQKRFLSENHRDDLKCIELPIDFLDQIVETSGDFLNELIDALEGKEE